MLRAASDRASGLSADNTSSSLRASGAVSRAVVRGSGAASRTRWALVPEKPKLETPAMAGRSRCGRGVAWVGTASGRLAQSTVGLGFFRCRLGGIVLFSRHSTALMRPAIPAAASAWPMLVFTEPTRQRSSEARAPTMSARACSSTGSPTLVPVPWASM